MIFLRFLLLSILAAPIISCAALDSILATPKPPTPTETPRPTATIVWFPPSITPSPEYSLTRVATPEMRPNVGAVILSDDFSNPEMWDIAASDEASADIAQSRLNLAAQSQIYMLSLRHETTLSNYYAEIAAVPNLCRDADSYGILIRANALSYYRFGLYCNGTVSAEKISGNSREVLQKPIPSGDAPLGAGKVVIGVWAVENEMRLFLNGRYQFSINNTSYTNGTLGVFVNAAGESPIVVSFSNLNVRAVK